MALHKTVLGTLNVRSELGFNRLYSNQIWYWRPTSRCDPSPWNVPEGSAWFPRICYGWGNPFRLYVVSAQLDTCGIKVKGYKSVIFLSKHLLPLLGNMLLRKRVRSAAETKLSSPASSIKLSSLLQMDEVSSPTGVSKFHQGRLQLINHMGTMMLAKVGGES